MSISDADIERLKASVPDGLESETWKYIVGWLAGPSARKERTEVDRYILRVLAERAGIVGPSADGEIPGPSRLGFKELRAALDEAVWAVKRHTLARPDDVVDIVFPTLRRLEAAVKALEDAGAAK